MNTTGYVLYSGPSRLNQHPIIAILTLHSKNRKTGDMPQVWILPADVLPTKAAASGEDEAVCGDCAFRPVFTVGVREVKNCYVTLIHGPNQIWTGFHRGIYSTDWPPIINRPVRWGSYGDPAALPIRILMKLADTCAAGHTAYTHQWRRFQALRHYMMASVNNADEQAEATRQGWRTFRVIQENDEQEENVTGEIDCPYPRTTCFKCRLCDGKINLQDRRKNITVVAHL